MRRTTKKLFSVLIFSAFLFCQLSKIYLILSNFIPGAFCLGRWGLTALFELKEELMDKNAVETYML
jgi:hypothetical protein